MNKDSAPPPNESPEQLRAHVEHDLVISNKRQKYAVWLLFIILGSAIALLVALVVSLSTIVADQNQTITDTQAHLKSIVTCNNYYQHQFQAAVVERARLSTLSNQALVHLIRQVTTNISDKAFKQDVQVYIDSINKVQDVKVPDPHYNCS